MLNNAIIAYLSQTCAKRPSYIKQKLLKTMVGLKSKHPNNLSCCGIPVKWFNNSCKIWISCIEPGENEEFEQTYLYS